MSNQFKHLDSLYPTVGNNRLFGEVVGIEVHYLHDVDETPLGVSSSKRKACYRNASVNAFHLHRVLCKEARELMRRSPYPVDLKALNKRLAYLVNLCYCREAANGNSQQYYRFAIEISTNGFETILKDREIAAEIDL